MSVAHRCHLLLLDASESRLLLVWRGTGWTLPYVILDDATPAFGHAARIASRANVNVQIIHEAPLTSVDGGFAHFYTLAVARDAAAPLAAPFGWHPLDSAPAGSVTAASSPLSRAQTAAVARVQQCLRASSAPFDNPALIRELDHWVAAQCADTGNKVAGPSEPHRAERHHRVARYPTAGGDVYFKGGRRSDVDEGALTTLLHRLAPDVFARPLALDHERQWFLMSSVPGTSPASSDYDPPLVDRFVRTLSQVQKQSSAAPDVRAHLASRACTSATLHVTKDALLAFATDAGAAELGLEFLSSWRDLDDAIEAALHRFDDLSLPATWIHPDLWSANVLMTPGRVSIIDLEDSMWGSPPLSLWRFMGDICRGRADAPQLWEAATRAACESWRPLIPEADLRAAFSLLPVIGRLLTFQMLEARRERRRSANDEPAQLPARGVAAASVVRGLLTHLKVARRPLPAPNVRPAAPHGPIRHAIVAEPPSPDCPAVRRPPVQLADVLAPLSLHEFLTRFVGTDLLLSRGEAGRFGSLLSWQELNEGLRHLRVSGRRIRIVQNGNRVSRTAYLARPDDESGSYAKARDVTAMLAAGATLVIDQVDELFPAVQELAEACEDLFHTYVGINLYAGWRADRGFDFHWDDHDTLILQLAGRKHWRVHRPAVEHPIRGDRFADSRQPDDSPVWEGHLTDGDLLYMPKGWWHVAQPVDEPSLHLTVGIGHATAFDALNWMLEQLHGAVDLRQPVSHLATEEARRQMSHVIREEVTAALTDDLIDRYIRQRDRAVLTRPRFTLPDILPASQHSFGSHDHLRLTTDRRLYFTAAADGTEEFAAGGGAWSCAPNLRPALDLLSNTRATTFAAMNQAVPETARIELYALVLGLLSSGALWVEHVARGNDAASRSPHLATATQES